MALKSMYAFIAVLPIVWLMIALGKLKIAGFRACIQACMVAAVIALTVKKMPMLDVCTAGLEGVINALWPICLVIIAALFTYNLMVATSAMDTIKNMLAHVSNDKRILMLLIGWGFGGFMEGMAGFGTAVAIPAGILISLGLEPVYTVVACLVANSTPTAFGSVGVPTATLAAVTGLDVGLLSRNMTIIQCILMFLTPFFLVCIIGKSIKALRGVFIVTLLASVSFTAASAATAFFIGPELPDILGSITSMLCIIAYTLSIHTKKTKISAPACKGVLTKPCEGIFPAEQIYRKYTVGEAVRAWLPFIFIFAFLLLTSKLLPSIHIPIAGIISSLTVFTGSNPTMLTIKWIGTPGIMIFIAASIGGFLQGASPARQAVILKNTLTNNIKTIVTICSVMAAAKIMSYSGMISDIASLLVALTGSYFPLISPLIGVIGAFVTGSGTSTAVLFGNLQVQTAVAIGMNPAWLAVANTMGAGIGKMICPQTIAIGAAAAGISGSENIILEKVIRYCILFFVIAGLICYFLPNTGLVA